MGFQFSGLYINTAEVVRDGKTRYYALVSAGVEAFRFGISQAMYDMFNAQSVGTFCILSGVQLNAFNGRVYPSAQSVEFPTEGG